MGHPRASQTEARPCP